MQENLSSLPLVKLRAMAKERGVKHIASTRKSELVEILQNLMEQENRETMSAAAEPVQQESILNIQEENEPKEVNTVREQGEFQNSGNNAGANYGTRMRNNNR